MELSDISFGGTRVPWNFMEYSMEFHGTLGGTRVPWNSMGYPCHLTWRPPNSTESFETRWFFYLATPEFHGIPCNIPCKSRVTCYWIKWQSQSSMEFHGTKWYFIWRHQSSMEFHGKTMEFHGTKLYFISRHQSSMEFHGIFHWITRNSCLIWNGALPIPWNPMELGDFLFGDSRVPWNSMDYPKQVQDNIVLIKMTIAKFHGIPWNKVIFHLAAPKFHGILWISMELSYISFGGTRVPWNIPWNSMEHLCHLKWRPSNHREFHGTRWFFIWRLQSSMEFHAIFHGIPWNTCVIWHGALLIPWNHLKRGDFFIWRLQSSMEFHGIFHASPG